MEKKLLPALILSLFAGAAMASDDAAKADKSMSGASKDSSVSSDASAQDKSMSGAAASGDSNKSSGSVSTSSIDAARLNELSADPKMTLFLRLDTDKNGRLSSQEISSGKDLLTLDVSGSGSGSNEGVDLISFKTAVTNSMLGMGGTTMASSSTGGASGSASGSADTSSSASSGSDAGNASSSASTDSDRNIQGADANSGADGGMLSDKVMKEVEERGGPTMLRGGPNPSPDELTPEQKLNNPNAGEGTGTQ